MTRISASKAQRFGLLLLLLFGLAPLAHAQSNTKKQERLDQVEEEISVLESRRDSAARRAEQAQDRVRQLSKELVAAGSRLRATEESVVVIERRIDALNLEEAAIRARLGADEDTLVRLIAMMERLKRRPAALALIQPETAIDTARSVSLIKRTVPKVDERARTLRADLTALAKIETDLARERFALQESREKLSAQQINLNRKLAERRRSVDQYRQQVRDDSARLAKLSKEAQDLKALLDAVIRLTPQPRPNQPKAKTTAPTQAPAPAILPGSSFGQSRGKLRYPVAGTRVLGFGQLDGVVKSRGAKYAATPGAQVYAPFDGRIAFAGSFRSYGLVLIIAHAGGYHSLLAGMTELYGNEGDRVLTGEPVGVMGSPARDGTQKRPELYLELRRNGTAINPSPWFVTQTAAR